MLDTRSLFESYVDWELTGFCLYSARPRVARFPLDLAPHAVASRGPDLPLASPTTLPALSLT